MELGKVINWVTKFVQERVLFPFGEQIHEFTLGDLVWVKDRKLDLLAPGWKGPYTVILTTPLLQLKLQVLPLGSIIRG